MSKPALTNLPLIPAPSKRPKTVRRNKETTNWSRGESRSADAIRQHNLNRVTPNYPPGDAHTEAARLYVSLFARRRVGVRVAQSGPGADGKVLVQTPLLCAGEARLGRVVGDV